MRFFLETHNGECSVFGEHFYDQEQGSAEHCLMSSRMCFDIESQNQGGGNKKGRNFPK